MSSPCPVEGITTFETTKFDSIVLVGNTLDALTGDLQFMRKPLDDLKEFDDSVGSGVVVAALPGPFKRLVYSSTGPVNRDYDDVRRFADAAEAGIKRAIKTGSKAPLLVAIGCERFVHAPFAAALGALQALYVPLEIREARPNLKVKATLLGLWSREHSERLQKFASAIESGRHVTRDIQGSDPERMAPPRVADYVSKYFGGSAVKEELISDVDFIEKNFPCMGAVNRAAKVVPRHNARVIRLFYEGEGPITETLFLVGKGVTYDTGGADVKAGGIMAGMHRDKGGAAAVAGFFAVLDKIKPKHLKVYGTMAMVRNSIGPNGYVADEIVTARSGVRVRVGNTDAEGRMAMVDCLCEAKEKALNEVNPQLYTIATLTGHAIIAMGLGYSIAMDNGPAKAANNSTLLREIGDSIGDMFEISSIKREDYDFHTGKSEYEDVLQCNNAPSSRTPRGHQSPSAFLIMTSGLDKHGIDSKQPLKYTHLDIAGSEGNFPGIPSGCPVPALCFRHLKEK